ncbi:MAG TPA: hypothetical protein VHZ03_27815 [Trebonia sp.]|jgi:hypothetical protein|nr:hypothetical protein [Trebonia sp.]
MALVDRRLNRRIVQVSSVSGGSILNAVLVHRGVNLNTVTSEEFDAVAHDITSVIARRGVLTKQWLAVAISLIIGCGALAGFGYSETSAPSVFMFLAVLIGAGIPLLWLGHFVTWRLRKSFFPGSPSRPLSKLSSTPVDHVFCASDLITGFPVYITTWDGGLLWRRTSDLGTMGGILGTDGELWSAKSLQLAEVVRASAGFPGIPPRRIAVGRHSRPGQVIKRVDRPGTFGGKVPSHPNWDKGTVMLLSDGGIVNNLGTQSLREDGFFRGKTAQRSISVLVAANASAPIAARYYWPYYVPGISVVSQLWRCLQIQNINTVVPRVASTRIFLKRRSQAGTYSDNVDLVVNLSEPTDRLESSLRIMMEEHRDTLRLRNPDHRKWEEDLAGHLRHWFDEHRDIPAEIDAKETLIETLENKVMREPSKIPGFSGILDHDALDDVTQTQWWVNLAALEKSYGEPRVPTTLGRFDATTIRMLVLRGYMHTYLASIAIRPWSGSRGIDDASKRIAERIASLGLPLRGSTTGDKRVL